MPSFVKLYSTLLHSTVWREDLPTKVLWVTMLAIADGAGKVWASVPGLAHAAGITVEDCRRALEKFSSPDPDSRTKEHEGRRIEEIDGGWQLLNYAKYRAMRDEDKRRDQTREATRRWRKKKSGSFPHNDHVSQGEPGRAQAYIENSAHALPDADAPGDEVSPEVDVSVKGTFPSTAPDSPLVRSGMWTREACSDWMERFGGTAPGGQIGRALKPLVGKHGWEGVRVAWRAYLSQTEAEYASAPRFAATYGRWSGTAPRVGGVAERTRANLEAWIASKEGES